MMKNPSFPPRSRGFTLVEILIAIGVFSIGLLGIAGLQVSGMRFTKGAEVRATAAMQAATMADRMRANRAAVQDGNYNTQGTMPTSSDKDCATVSCTPAETATYDLLNWNTSAGNTKPTQSNADLLPGGRGVVCIDSTPDDGSTTSWACDNTGSMYAIKLLWTERTTSGSDGTDSATEQRMVMRVMQ